VFKTQTVQPRTSHYTDYTIPYLNTNIHVVNYDNTQLIVEAHHLRIGYLTASLIFSGLLFYATHFSDFLVCDKIIANTVSKRYIFFFFL